MLIAFFVNDIEREYENYTTTVLAHQAMMRGHRVCYITPEDFVLNPDDTLFAHGRFLPKRKYKDRGLVVLGFPSNDFGSQEPGSEADIKAFCSSKYDVTFPMFSKLHVKGADQHPLYAALTGPESPAPGPVKWNFGKFLVGKDGKLITRYDSGTKPDDAKLIEAVEGALK